MAKGLEVTPIRLPKKKPIKLSQRCRRIIEGFIILLCASGLIFQVTQLFMQYLSRRTIVHLDFETLWYNRLPAITICYPNLIAMNKTADKFPELKPVYDQYKRNLSEAKDYDFHNYKLQKHLNSLYEEKFVDFVKQKNLSFGQLSELSIPFRYEEKIYEQSQLRKLDTDPQYTYTSTVHFGNASRHPIDILVTGLRRFKNGTIRYDEVVDTYPIESVVFNYKINGDMSKCFTFFSHLNKSLRYYQMNIKEIHLTIRHHEDWFPPTIYNKRDHRLLFAMHSPNTIPQNWDTFMELETRWYYEIRYNRWKTILLEQPYKTGCINYDMYTTSGYRLRSDCVHHCITKHLDTTCMNCDRSLNKSECDPCFIRSDFLWRVETAKVHQDINREMCPDITEDEVTQRDICLLEHKDKIIHSCDAQCPQECHNRYYNFAIFSKDRLSSELKDSESPWDIETKIFIGHNQLPDQTTQHIEEMTFVTFAGNLGGLFGIWMGLSAFAILHYILKLI